MAHSKPFEQLTGTLTVYIADVGTAIPGADETPGVDWTELGCTDGEQSVQHAGALEYFYDNCHQGPVKAVRPEEDTILAFTLVGLTLEKYGSVISSADNVDTNTTPNPDVKTLPLKRGFTNQAYALIFRGEALSPYGVWPGQYVIPRGVFDGEPQPTFAKDGRVGLEIEFRALEDPDQAKEDKLGWLEVNCSPATCLGTGTITPAVIATYDPVPEVVAGATVQGVWVQGLDTDGTYAYISSFTYYDLATDRNVIDRVPLSELGVMLTGALARDLRYLNANAYQGLVYDIRVKGNYVYAGGINGLWILDKTTMTLVGRCDYMELGWGDAPYINVLDVSSDENYVFVGGSGFGMAVIDVRDKAHPAAVFYDTLVDVEMLALQEPYLYIADDAWQFVVYDVSTPATPTKILEDNLILEGHFAPTAQYVGNDIGVFAADTDTVSILSLADPENVTELSQIVITPVNDYAVVLGARLAGLYVILLVLDVASGGNGQAQVLYYNVSDPENPTLEYSLDVGDPGNEDEEGWLRGFYQYLVVSNNLVSQMLVIDSCSVYT